MAGSKGQLTPWVGLAHVAPALGSAFLDENERAVSLFLARVRSKDDVLPALEAECRACQLVLLQVDDLEPFSRSMSFDAVDPGVLEMLDEMIANGWATQFFQLHAYPADAPDESED